MLLKSRQKIEILYIYSIPSESDIEITLAHCSRESERGLLPKLKLLKLFSKSGGFLETQLFLFWEKSHRPGIKGMYNVYTWINKTFTQ